MHAAKIELVGFVRYTPLLRVGYKRPLTIDDEFALPEHLKTRHSYPIFWKVWTRQMEQAPLTEKVCRHNHIHTLLPSRQTPITEVDNALMVCFPHPISSHSRRHRICDVFGDTR